VARREKRAQRIDHTRASTPNDDYDSPWKDMLEHAFPEFMAFFFPQAYGAIN
jgi:hypothetical protein